MKILLIASQFESNGGGADNSARVIAYGMASLGHDVTVICSTNKSKPKVEIKKNVRIHSIFPINLYWVGDKDEKGKLKKVLWQLIDFWNPLAFIQVAIIIKKENPDVIHYQKIRGFSPSVWLAGKLFSKAKLIHTSRDYELISPEGTLMSSIGERVLKKHPITYLYYAPRAFFSKVIDVSTAPSNFTINRILEYSFFPNSISITIPNSHGYSRAEILARKPKGKGKSEFKLLFMGRLAETKGLIKLIRYFKSSFLNSDKFSLLIGGDGPLMNRVLELSESVNNIQVLGHINGKEKDRIYSESDVLIVPSEWEEVFGNVIIEAYSFGTPVIVTNLGGMPELVEEGKTGWILKEYDQDSFKNLILYTSGIDLYSISKNCIQKSLEFTSERIIGRYHELYEKCTRNEN